MFASLNRPDLAGNEGRRAWRAPLHAAIGAITALHSRDAVAAVLAAAAVPHAPIAAIEEVMDMPFVAATQLHTQAPDGATIRLPPAAVDTAHLAAVDRQLPFAPAYGEHSDAVLAEAGLPRAAIADLRARGVVA